jgi:hypothetical protein
MFVGTGARQGLDGGSGRELAGTCALQMIRN